MIKSITSVLLTAAVAIATWSGRAEACGCFAPPDPTVPVVTICGSGGGRSETAARLLRERGFRDVRSLCGGTTAWARHAQTKGAMS